MKSQQQPLPATQVRDGGGYTGIEPRGDGEGVLSAVVGEGGVEKEGMLDASVEKPVRGEIRRDAEMKAREEKKYKDDPWKKARGGPSEEWQPKAWDPNDMPAAKR